MQGTDVSLQDEFLEWLLKQILDGIGVPLELLGYSTAEFSRTVAMINGKFLKSVVGKQIQFEKTITNFIQKLVNINDPNLALNNFKVTFNRPTVLTQQNLSDQIGNKNEIAQFFTNNLLGESNADTALKDAVTREILRDLTPNIDWTKYDDIVKKVKVNLKKDKLNTKEGTSENTEEGTEEDENGF